MDLSTDHKPNLPDERKRIRNAGGRLTRDSRRVWCGGLGGQARVQYGPYRVNGDLAMSRSIGIILFDLFLISCILAFYLFHYTWQFVFQVIFVSSRRGFLFQNKW
jgi:hypothetical protein